jgi:hypothetical protein
MRFVGLSIGSGLQFVPRFFHSNCGTDKYGKFRKEHYVHGTFVMADSMWYIFFKGGVFGFFYLRYSTLLHLPPLRFNCVGGCWDRTQDNCDYDIGCQTL